MVASRLGRSVDIPRLCQAMRTDRIALQRFRSNRREMVREYLGNNWNDEGTGREVPMNLIALYAGIMTRALVPKNPRVLLSTFSVGQRPAVKGMQRWVNQQIVKMNFAETIKRIVLDALFSVGVCKVALATPADAANVGWRLKAGGVFAERVDLDDWVFDTHARDFDEVAYMGHRIRVPLLAIRDSQLYNSKARRLLMPQYDQPYNLDGDERISTLGRGLWGTTTEEIEDYVDLWEIYLPRHRLVITLADDQMTGAAGYGPGVNEALRVQNWLGPDRGPYRVLSYMTVPGNAMGKGPAQDLIDLHRADNNIYRKLIRQAHRFKENTFVYGEANEDGTRVMQSNDGDLIKVEQPDKIQTRSWGGPNEQLQMLASHLKDQFDFMAGGLSLMGGLAPQSKTLGQDKMLNENSSHQVQDMQQSTIGFVSEVLECMNWFFWYDPNTVQRSEIPLGGSGRSMTTQVRPADRVGPMPDVSVDPYSMLHQSPQERLAFLNQTVEMITPMMPLLQQQGIFFDVNTWMRKISEYGDSPDLTQMFSLREPIQQSSGGQGGGDQMNSMPGNTTRNYNRRSIGMDTPANRQNDMQNALRQSSSQRQRQAA